MIRQIKGRQTDKKQDKTGASNYSQDTDFHLAYTV